MRPRPLIQESLDIGVLERDLALLTLSMIAAMRLKAFSADDASAVFFVPALMRFHDDARLGEDVRKMINLGSDLEKVARIIPDAVGRSLDELELLATRILRESIKSTGPTPLITRLGSRRGTKG